jgi:RNA polymerase sigma factor (sigma-70 family)
VIGSEEPDILAVMSDVTQILAQIELGDPAAASQLLPLVYDELRRLARAKLGHEKPGQTLQATALVHEAYLRLVGPAGPVESEVAVDAEIGQEMSEVGGQTSAVGPTSDLRSPTSDLRPPTSGTLAPSPEPRAPSFSSRGHFFAAAAEAMRRILVESARRKNRLKRGGDLARQPLEEDEIAMPEVAEDLEELDAALDRLAAKDARKAELVKLRYFAGLTQEHAAEALGISVSTADRDWSYARAWLFREMTKNA